MTKTPTPKRILTPEQLARLTGSLMRDADRRATPDPRQTAPVSDEDLRSFPGVRS